MIADRAKMVACTRGKDVAAVLACLKISGEPLKETVFEEDSGEHIYNVALDGWHVKYSEDEREWRTKMMPYVVVCPLWKRPMRFEGWEHLLDMERLDPRIGFLRKWAGLTEDIFKIAELNPLVHIPIALDVVKYVAHLGTQDVTDSLLCYAADCHLAAYIHKQKTTIRKM